jgi:transmembrane sensor
MSENWSEADQADLEGWLSQSTANRVAYWRLDSVWAQAQRMTVLREPMRPQPTNSSRRTRFKSFGFAIGLGAAAIAGVFGAQYLTRDTVFTYATPVGGHLIVSLSDGSKIELNTDSVLRVSVAGRIRTASLEKGEALFQIQHDPSRPFVVSVGHQRVTDLGTKFTVLKDAHAIRVALIEGKAEIESLSSPSGNPRVLKPGDIAVVVAGTTRITRASIADMSEALAWRRGMIEFEHATLAEAANELNRYNRTKIVIADPKIAHLTIHGTFRAADAWAFADVAQAYFGLHAEKRDGAVVLSR